MKVARKIVLVMLLSFLGVFAVLAYVDSRRVVVEIRSRTTNELRVAGRALAPTLAEIARVEGAARARACVDAADANLAAVGSHMRWVALDGSDARVRLDAAQRAELASGRAVAFEGDDDGVIRVLTPVATQDAAIEIVQDAHQRDLGASAIVTRRLAIASIAILVAALFSVGAAIVMVGAPLRKLTEHARRIGAGDLGRRLPLTRRDEIGVLATEMNTMSERLAEAQRRTREEAEAKAKAEAQVRHADKMSTVGTLAAGMAHELGTPLNVVGGRAKLIESSTGASPDVVRDARIIGGQVERMTRIMRGLLDFARRTPTTKATTDLHAMTRRVLDLLAPLAQKREVSLELEPDAEPLEVDVDVGQAEQALANIVLNAIHATPRDGVVKVTLHRVRATPPAERDARDFACVSVTDEGAGIREKDMPHVFEPFFTTKDVGEGTGLGLAVTYGILHDHHGFVDLHSTVDVGTRASLYFPV